MPLTDRHNSPVVEGRDADERYGSQQEGNAAVTFHLEQEATIAQLKKELQATASHQHEQIEALTEGAQKVSARLEANRAAPQTVLNNQ
ncbi:MAG TPA: hypothetical protein VGY75_01370 [Candidatus Udaeobacter sp.]|nr:hypothetical protein [Candidatus Udaeobacter sp.]